MLSTLIIVFREVLEAMLVVGIATAAAREVNIATRWIYGGVLGGLLAAVIVAFFADAIATSMQGMGQEILNASVLIAASLLMAWTAIWMGKHGREVSKKIRQTCSDVQGSDASKLVLAIVVGLAVAREGSEVVLFLYGVAAAGVSNASEMLSGGMIGIVLGVLVAMGLYRSLVHIPMRHVFLVVTSLIVLLSAGMASQGVAYLVMVGELPAWGEPIWNTAQLIPEQGLLGQVLQALMGYDDRPSGMQVFAFLLVLSLTWLAIYLQKNIKVRAVNTVAAMLLMGLAISMQPIDAQAKQVYSPIVEQGEVELEYLLDYAIDSDPNTNTSARHQFELEWGVTDRWQTAVYGDFRKRPGQGFAYQGLKWENIYQLFEQGERWLDAGLYFEYIAPQSSLNKSDAVEFKLLLEKQFGAMMHTANLVFQKELGANAKKNTLVEYTWRSKWRKSRVWEPAIEIYGSLGELGNTKPLSQQSHQIGPVFMGKLRNGF
ncbi:MAG: FTR1 family protein, partial [Mariprofundaceae bacterium]|nr:FTR1 family protein [Mariprofundaceae bacterium]